LSLRRRDSAGERCSLLVIAGDTSFRFPLPVHGEVLIGRAPEAGLFLQDASVSRQHARLLLTLGEVHIADLGSHNGTYVGGERVSAPRPLVSGDIIAIGDITLLFQREAAPPGPRPLLDLVLLRQRLAEEVARCALSARPATILCLHAGQPPLDREGVTAALAPHLRPIDTAAWSDGGQLLVLLPEQDGEAVATRLFAALRALSPAARGGIATCPEDGGDADTLLSAARAAAAAAQPGELADVACLVRTIAIGDRTIVVADPAMARLYGLLDRLARSELPVLICGETGAGKELAAAALHHGSGRAGPLVAVNCAAIPESLFESELFGYEKGAFSGATGSKRGLLESANGGTVFLDEAARCSWTRSASCRCRSRPSSCASWRSAASCASATCANGSWTCAWWPRPTAIWRPR
jgi:hypothetical protein